MREGDRVPPVTAGLVGEKTQREILGDKEEGHKKQNKKYEKREPIMSGGGRLEGSVEKVDSADQEIMLFIQRVRRDVGKDKESVEREQRKNAGGGLLNLH